MPLGQRQSLQALEGRQKGHAAGSGAVVVAQPHSHPAFLFAANAALHPSTLQARLLEPLLPEFVDAIVKAPRAVFQRQARHVCGEVPTKPADGFGAVLRARTRATPAGCTVATVFSATASTEGERAEGIHVQANEGLALRLRPRAMAFEAPLELFLPQIQASEKIPTKHAAEVAAKTGIIEAEAGCPAAHLVHPGVGKHGDEDGSGQGPEVGQAALCKLEGHPKRGVPQLLCEACRLVLEVARSQEHPHLFQAMLIDCRLQPTLTWTVRSQVLVLRVSLIRRRQFLFLPKGFALAEPATLNACSTSQGGSMLRLIPEPRQMLCERPAKALLQSAASKQLQPPRAATSVGILLPGHLPLVPRSSPCRLALAAQRLQAVLSHERGHSSRQIDARRRGKTVRPPQVPSLLDTIEQPLSRRRVAPFDLQPLRQRQKLRHLSFQLRQQNR